MTQRTTHPKGFSLIELMIAMTITVMVSGAIYGLMTGGQQAFRREPALADRQQNIRLAMDLIMRDVAGAGGGMPGFIQTFTPGLDSCVACPPSPGAANLSEVWPPGGANTDELEIMTNSMGRGQEMACGYEDGGASHGRLVAGTTNLKEGDVTMVLLADGTWTLRAVTGDPDGTNNAAEGTCDAHQAHADVPFNSGAGDTTGFNLPGGICAGDGVPSDPPGTCLSCEYHGTPVPGNACCSQGIPPSIAPCTIVGFLQAEMVRYRIRREPATGVPNLERWSSGRTSNFGAGGIPIYQVIARGIDDLQVEYIDADGNVFNGAPQVDYNGLNYGSLIRSVRVTLSARSEEPNVTGVRRTTAGPAALRGRLTSTGTPRAALDTLGTLATARNGGWTGPTWY